MTRIMLEQAQKIVAAASEEGRKAGMKWRFQQTDLGLRSAW